jgi:hypothetical protein
LIPVVLTKLHAQPKRQKLLHAIDKAKEAAAAAKELRFTPEQAAAATGRDLAEGMAELAGEVGLENEVSAVVHC